MHASLDWQTGGREPRDPAPATSQTESNRQPFRNVGSAADCSHFARHKLHGRVIVSCGETRAVTPTCMCTSKTPRIGEVKKRRKKSAEFKPRREFSLFDDGFQVRGRRSLTAIPWITSSQPRGTMIARSVSRSSPISFRFIPPCFVPFPTILSPPWEQPRISRG